MADDASLFAFASVAALTVLEHRPAGSLLILDSAYPDFRDRFLLKADDNVLSLAACDIVSITGADDYAGVATPRGKPLV